MGVFKAYDVRGVYPTEVNEDLFRRIGLAAVQALGQPKTVVVGRDMRESGLTLAAAMIKGLTQAGANVVDIGMASTPMLYFATAFLKAGAGVQITASHNPAEYNGCKWCREDAIPVAYDSGLADVEKLVASDAALPAPREGKVDAFDIGPEYRGRLLKFAGEIKPLTVAVDAGNGVMGAFLPALFEKLPCELIPLYFEPDGTFPNHEANPLNPENMRDLRAKVAETTAELGVAFDGDGDRAMFVDETGELIPADFVTALFAEEMLRREPGATILYDLRSSWVVKETIEAHGGVAGMTRVGHSFIKARMRETKAIFAGELSGHFYWRDIHYTDNAEMAMLTMLTLLSKSKKKLSELIKPFRRYYASGEINFEVDDAAATIDRLEAEFKGQVNETLRLDGLSLIADDWWANIRPSNTEPVVRLNMEAKTQSKRDSMLSTLTRAIGGKPAKGH